MFQGIFYGLVPHSFCIAFIALSIVGATAATSVVRGFLLLPLFFPTLIALSLLFATVSAAFYLRRSGGISLARVQARWKYLSVLYGTTLAVNLLFIGVLFPALAGLGSFGFETPVAASTVNTTQRVGAVAAASKTVTIEVTIPCDGHAPLILHELQGQKGITAAKYQGRNLFRVSYDPNTLSMQQILGMEIFRSFPARARS